MDVSQHRKPYQEQVDRCLWICPSSHADSVEAKTNECEPTVEVVKN